MANIITNKQLVDYAKAMLNHEYWYGTYGQDATEKLLAEKKKQYPKYYNPDNYSKGWTCDGRKVFDCCGLLKGAIWCNGDPNAKPKYDSTQDLSANDMFKKGSSESGPISTLPEIPGTLVRYDGHVGIYIGEGVVIEARGHNYGVVKTILSQRKWTNWYKCKWINYAPSKKTVNVTVIVEGVTYNGNIEEV